MPPTVAQAPDAPASLATCRMLPDAELASALRRPIVHSAMTSGTPMPNANAR